ncbi:adenylyl-sulfate kinase [Stutzerimonas stutzeri]|uniref:adenylyl-sulfate kinase n=1 Tax=Stutzerimonas stutzeri TaxID=316 RepID=UPI00066B5381|nr:adenylyl-sulfate kinase [Stutzerimonas stutzeri]MDH0182324.1 adenylyl-sulfate kinase [Stutzerimonas stutzeri]MDH1246940.1 adenylyl-sulfate kinase [Stutzerimonas stutzeri]CAB5527035.1 Adenylyl-sulfate kinase [Stutzerimonas stutzeri]CAB5537412.1 Adenylyl-sulfate kinase [Stutzerimonas stutzeri]CAC9076273.1 Adenylyl-sulfate kinase [Stutzerimonas stutzeri]
MKSGSSDIVMQRMDVSAATRARMKGQRPVAIWLTGLSAAGKSTIANALEVALVERGRHTYLLDGDNVRLGLCRDLGFTDQDRVENIRRVAELGRLFVDAGLIVITAFISPFRADRALARSIIGGDAFIEVFVDTPLAECERRDPKGLYGKARAGLIKNFTGIDSAYEPPLSPEIRVGTVEQSLSEVVSQVLGYLDQRTSDN